MSRLLLCLLTCSDYEDLDGTQVTQESLYPKILPAQSRQAPASRQQGQHAPPPPLLPRAPLRPPPKADPIEVDPRDSPPQFRKSTRTNPGRIQDARRPLDTEDGPLSPSSHSAADSASPSPHSAADLASPWQSGWGALYSPQVRRENPYDVFLHSENEYGFETAIDPVPPSAQRALRSHPQDEATLKPQRRRSKSSRGQHSGKHQDENR